MSTDTNNNIEIKKRRPGRPKKNPPIPKADYIGITKEPSNKDITCEFIDSNTSFYKNLILVVEEFKFEHIFFHFFQDKLIIYLNNKYSIYVEINGNDLFKYYSKNDNGNNGILVCINGSGDDVHSFLKNVDRCEKIHFKYIKDVPEPYVDIIIRIKSLNADRMLSIPVLEFDNNEINIKNINTYKILLDKTYEISMLKFPIDDFKIHFPSFQKKNKNIDIKKKIDENKLIMSSQSSVSDQQTIIFDINDNIICNTKDLFVLITMDINILLTFLSKFKDKFDLFMDSNNGFKIKIDKDHCINFYFSNDENDE